MGNAAAAAMMLTLLLGGALALRLSAGPVSLGDLARAAAEQISADMPGRTLEVEDLVFDISRKGLPPGLRLKGLTLRDKAGEIIARAPEVSLRIHVLDAFRGVISPTRVVVSGLAMTVTRTADGSVRAGVAISGRDAAPAATMAQAAPALGAVGMLREAGGMISALSRLQLVEGRDLRLTFNDAVTGGSWTATGMQMRVRRDGTAVTGELMAAQPGAPAPWLRLLAHRSGVAGGDGEETEMHLTLAGATGAEVAAAFPPLAALGAVSAPLTGRLSGVIADSGAIREMTAWVSAGAGRIRGINGNAGRLFGARIDMTLEADADRLVIDEGVIAGGLGALRLSGAGTLRRAADGRAAGAALSLDIAELALTQAAGFAEPMSFGPGRLAGDASFEGMAFRLSEAAIDAPGLALSASGGASLGADGWQGDIRAHAIAPIAAEMLVPNWPRGLAPGARRWVAKNIRGGTVDALDVTAAFSERAASVDMGFTFRDVAASALDGMPLIENAVGRGRVVIPAIGPGRFDVSVISAGVTPPEGGTIALDGSSIAIPDLLQDVPFGEITALADGAIADFLALVDQPPLGLISKLGADLGPVGGRAAGTVRLRLPLLAGLSVEDIDIAVAADLADLSLTAPGLGLPVSARRAALTVDGDRLTLEGAAIVDGSPANVAWEETFAPAAGVAPTKLALSGAIGAKTLTRLGIDALTIADGAGWARARIAVSRAGAASLSADLSFDKAAIAIPAINWRKAAGAKARASIAGTASGGALEVSRLDLDAPGLAVAGALRADLAGGRGVLSARMTRIAIAGLAEGAIDYASGPEGETVRFDGAFLDMSAMSEVTGPAASGEAGGPLSLDARVERLVLAEGMVLHGARATAARNAGGALTARLIGNAAGGAPVAASWDMPAPGGPSHLRLTADDAGAAMRGLNLFNGGRGGALTLDARLSADGRGGPITGAVVITDMVLRDDSALVRGLAAASLFGVVERAGTGGLSFARVEAPFRIENEVVRIDDALARGASLGITLDGTWDRGADRLDMRGVLSPAYAINGVLNRVPIIGALLGGEGEGLFGVTFSVTGSAEDPQVSANPLSALAPGVLRGVFGGASKETRDPDAPPPAPEPERVDR